MKKIAFAALALLLAASLCACPAPAENDGRETDPEIGSDSAEKTPETDTPQTLETTPFETEDPAHTIELPRDTF